MTISNTSFKDNYATSSNGDAAGGAVVNFMLGDVGVYEDNFYSDDPSDDESTQEAYDGIIQEETAYGAFIGTPEEYMEANRDKALTIINSSFTNNSVTANNGNAWGGAIYSNADLNIVAKDGYTSLFEGNTANGEPNAIYMTPAQVSGRHCTEQGCEDETFEFVPTLTLQADSEGIIEFRDPIAGDKYDVAIRGDGTGEVYFNTDVKGINKLSITPKSVLHVGLNKVIEVTDMIAAKEATSGIAAMAVDNPVLKVDVNVDMQGNSANSGQIKVSGDIEGDYDVIVNAQTADVLDDKSNTKTKFIDAANDDEDTPSRFTVARVIGSPFMWDAAGEDGEWYLTMNDEENPDFDPDPDPDPDPEPTPGPDPKPEPRNYTPEVVAAVGLHDAAIEQTRSLMRNVRSQSTAHHYGESLNKHGWAYVHSESANIESPADMKAKISGLDAGFDLQDDEHNALGLFASYRYGDYDLSGKGDKVHSTLGSEIDIDSYMLGVYYRYESGANWVFGSIYGGVQKAKVKTDDGYGKFDTDGKELSFGIEGGHSFEIGNSLYVEPMASVYYRQIKFDDATDNVGKDYSWKYLRNLEAEIGAKLEKKFTFGELYIKPSLVQNFAGGNKVKISGMNSVETTDNRTLERVEIGGRYGFNDKLSAYAWGSYTMGSDYDATAGGLGVSYAW